MGSTTGVTQSGAGRTESPRVLVLASAISDSWGGEAVLPIHVFKGLRRRGIDAWISSRDIEADELRRILGEDFDRWIPVPNGFPERICSWLWRLNLPLFPREGFLCPAILMTQFRQRAVVRHAIRRHAVNIAHQVIPVAPRLPTALDVREIPFVLGPLNGGMDYPPGFQSDETSRDGALRDLLRKFSRVAHALLPGTTRATCVMVANRRTLQALPRVPEGMLLQATENGIDSAYWSARPPSNVARAPGEPVRFVFSGALEPIKGCQWAIEALAKVRAAVPVHLDIVGRDFGIRSALESRVSALGLDDAVTFHGFLPQQRAFEVVSRGDVFVLPSIRECGGAVIMEAMAAGKPVISVNWGGPADYVTPETGVLVEPESPEALVEGVATAMLRLARNPQLRLRMGAAGRERAMALYTWEAKIDGFCELYAALLRAGNGEAELPRHPTLQPIRAQSSDRNVQQVAR